MMEQTFDRPKIDWQRREQPSSKGISLLPLRRSGARARWRLYCLPYAGASAGIFRSWLELLPPDIDIWGVEYPGHGTRIGEPLIDRIERLAEPLADAVAAETGMPYAFFGHSMGSLVAFEICHKLTERRTRMPELLIVSGHRAPHLPSLTPPVHAARHAEFIAHLRELGATPPEVFGSPELLDLILPILRSDFRACETYAPPDRYPLHMTVAVYGGLADVEAGREALQAWEQETTGACVVRMFPGGHFFLRDSPSRVAAALEHDLANALQMASAKSCVG
jgi:medium-chain acyl-[acyl-carrier-protein] hydrolase